jgi:transcriptional regulator with GAF, ATPase, and Fis domain
MVAAIQRQTVFASLRERETHLREESARLAAAVAAAELGFSDWRTLDTPIFLDDRIRDLLGIGPGDEARLPDIWLSRIDASARGLVQDHRRRVLAGEIERAAIEYRYAHPSRGPIWLRHVWHRLSDDSRTSAAGRLIGAVLDITEGRAREDALKAAHEEVKDLHERLKRENVYLRKEMAHASGGALVSGQSAGVTRAMRLAEQVATTDSTVLLTGETGVGKERFAAFIHEASARGHHHMVRVNCSAIPSALIESELFGREKGAFTGALSRQIGRFELAQGSTLLLDEIGDLPLEVQVKLLGVLQDHTIERLGSPAAISVNVRIIAATNRDLEAAVQQGTFRADLYYRLNVFPIRVPPLRERLEDLPLLVEQLVEELGRTMRKRFTAVEPASLEALAQYPWPGNVRELRNVLERAMILSPGPTLTVDPPNAPVLTVQAGRMADAKADDRDLLHFERDHILRVLEETGWRIRGRKAAAEVLGLKPTTLEARMARLGINRPRGQRQ